MNKKKSAFTLLEVMISVLILTIAVWTIYGISSQTKNLLSKSEYSITAMYLAQEWLEFVKTIRDERISESYNSKNWWDKFLTQDLWFWWSWSGWYVVKKLQISKNNLKLVDAGVNFDKEISSVDDICTDVWIYKHCIYEYINLSNEWNQESTILWNNFFRKIKIKKDFWEKNLITVFSEIFWEEKWKIRNFILEKKFWNIAIN